jgi:hypothetical protein
VSTAAGDSGSSPSATGQARRLWAAALGAGVLAGILSWLGGEALQGIVRPRLVEAKSKGRLIRVATRHDQAVADAENAGVAFAVAGGVLSAGLGAAGGLGRGSLRAAAFGVLLGLILGSLAAIGASAAVLPAYNAYGERHPEDVSQNLMVPLLVHVAVYGAGAAGGGLAFAWGLGARDRRLPCILGAMAGAILAAISFDLISPAIFPLARTTQLVPETLTARAVSRIALSVLGAAGAAFAAGAARRVA